LCDDGIVDREVECSRCQTLLSRLDTAEKRNLFIEINDIIEDLDAMCRMCQANLIQPNQRVCQECYDLLLYRVHSEEHVEKLISCAMGKSNNASR